MLLLLVINTGRAAEGLILQYQLPADSAESTIRQQLQQSSELEALVELINQQFIFAESLTLVFGGDEGPLYGGDTREIRVPFQFVQEVEERFATADYQQNGISPQMAAMDALLHTLLHELAHAFIDLYQLPVLGKEEDAADSLATVLLIDYFEQGQEIAISAADLFELESADSEVLDESDFWDEHSLDAQRFYSTLCHVYGSDPQQYGYLSQELGFSEERAELCIDEYHNISASWQQLLEPFVYKLDEKSDEKIR